MTTDSSRVSAVGWSPVRRPAAGDHFRATQHKLERPGPKLLPQVSAAGVPPILRVQAEKVAAGPACFVSHFHVRLPTMKLSNPSAIPVYTIAGASTARPLPEWLARKRKRSLKNDLEYANRVELLQDFEFEEASSCVRVSEDGEWVMSTGKNPLLWSACMGWRVTWTDR